MNGENAIAGGLTIAAIVIALSQNVKSEKKAGYVLCEKTNQWVLETDYTDAMCKITPAPNPSLTPIELQIDGTYVDPATVKSVQMAVRDGGSAGALVIQPVSMVLKTGTTDTWTASIDLTGLSGQHTFVFLLSSSDLTYPQDTVNYTTYLPYIVGMKMSSLGGTVTGEEGKVIFVAEGTNQR